LRSQAALKITERVQDNFHVELVVMGKKILSVKEIAIFLERIQNI